MNTRVTNKTYKKLEDGRYIESCVYYCLGGLSYFTYKQQPRCYFLSCEVVKIEKFEGHYTIQSTPFSGSGFSHVLMEVKKNIKKQRLEAIKMAADMLPEMREKLAAKAGTKLAVLTQAETMKACQTNGVLE